MRVRENLESNEGEMIVGRLECKTLLLILLNAREEEGWVRHRQAAWRTFGRKDDQSPTRNMVQME
jgi:hypothetical protein